MNYWVTTQTENEEVSRPRRRRGALAMEEVLLRYDYNCPPAGQR